MIHKKPKSKYVFQVVHEVTLSCHHISKMEEKNHFYNCVYTKYIYDSQLHFVIVGMHIV